jgi:hypothetical protein
MSVASSSHQGKPDTCLLDRTKHKIDMVSIRVSQILFSKMMSRTHLAETHVLYLCLTDYTIGCTVVVHGL